MGVKMEKLWIWWAKKKTIIHSINRHLQQNNILLQLVPTWTAAASEEIILVEQKNWREKRNNGDGEKPMDVKMYMQL